MKKQIYQKVLAGIKRSTLDRIVDSLLRERKPTRSSLSEACNVSIPTVSKVFEALCDSGLARQNASNGIRNEKYIDFSPSLHVAVLDLSSPIYKMVVIQKHGNVRISECHECDGDISPDENLVIFLSKCIGKLANAGIGNYFVCVIYADNAPREISLINYALSKEKSRHVEQIVSEVMRRAVLLHLTVSEALYDAVKYVSATKNKGGTCFLFIGSTLSMCYIRGDGATVVSSPERFLIDGEMRADTVLSNAFSHDSLFGLCCRIVNLAFASFSPEQIVIESDRVSFDADKITDHLKLRMPIKDKAPVIVAMHGVPSLACLGAYYSALSAIIKIYILASND